MNGQQIKIQNNRRKAQRPDDIFHAHDLYEISSNSDLSNISKISEHLNDSFDPNHYKDYNQYD